MGLYVMFRRTDVLRLFSCLRIHSMILCAMRAKQRSKLQMLIAPQWQCIGYRLIINVLVSLLLITTPRIRLSSLSHDRLDFKRLADKLSIYRNCLPFSILQVEAEAETALRDIPAKGLSKCHSTKKNHQEKKASCVAEGQYQTLSLTKNAQ
jgi:hypothetical protein